MRPPGDGVAKDSATRREIDQWAELSLSAIRSLVPRQLVHPGVATDARLPSLEVPTLLMVGENEKMNSSREAVRSPRNVAPQIETVLVPEAAHDLALVHTELVDRQVLEFQDRRERPADHAGFGRVLVFRWQHSAGIHRGTATGTILREATMAPLSGVVRRVIREHRRALLLLLLLLMLPVVAGVASQRYCRGEFRRQFIELHGSLTSAAVSFVERRDGHELFSLSLEDDRGLTVRGLLKVPAESAGPGPALLILGGVRTGKQTIEYIEVTRGVVLLALDYPYYGRKQGLSPLAFARAMPAIRRAIIRTVPAAMLAVDYLSTRGDVDPGRIVLAGGSVGAIFVPAIAATDTRIAAAAILLGGGDIRSLLRANLDDLGWFGGPASWLGEVLTCPLEPLRYVGDITPRPVFMLNATADPAIPTRCSELLHAAAHEPKTVRWIEAGHVTITETDFHQLITHELVDWMLEEGLIAPHNFAPDE